MLLQLRPRPYEAISMKHARPPLTRCDLERRDALLTTGDVARFLRVHPKHVYRLLRRGLPGHRVGGEWRFLAPEVLRWSGALPAISPPEPARRSETEPSSATTTTSATPLVAANGDIAVERLLARLTASGGALLGHVQADRGGGLELLKRGDVMAAGSHGSDIPEALEDERLAFIHLVDRQVGLAVRRGVRLRTLRQLRQWKVASRPPTAGVRAHFDVELRRQGVDPAALHSEAVVLPSHRDVVCAVARGEADVGLASQAWAARVGLSCVPLRREAYGLLVRASLLGDLRVVRLCEIAQSSAFRRELEDVAGYDTQSTGIISYRTPAKRS
jgi:excisionase family DNA binding protein